MVSKHKKSCAENRYQSKDINARISAQVQEVAEQLLEVVKRLQEVAEWWLQRSNQSSEVVEWIRVSIRK